MGINILTEFKTKDNRSEDLIALLRKLLPESMQHGGAEKVSIRQNQDDPNDIVSAQRWETREAYVSYFAWRTQGGITAQVEEILKAPISIRFFNEVPMDVAGSNQ
ncbi:MAG: putative quinol monooxygenase [Pyrinomonadaceae bacterium]